MTKIKVNAGDNVLIRDAINQRESCARVMATIPELIFTFDGSLIERFDAEGWNASRTRHIVSKVDLWPQQAALVKNLPYLSFDTAF